MKLISSIIVASISTISMAASVSKRGSRAIEANIDWELFQHQLDAVDAIDQMVTDEINGWQDNEWDIFWYELDEMVNDYEIVNGIANEFDLADLLKE